MSTATPPRSLSADLQTLLVEFDASGQSAAAFARTRGIALWRIYHALNRRRGTVRPRAGQRRPPVQSLVPVRVVQDQAASTAKPLELVLAGGHRLLIGADFDPVLLRRVLGELARC